MTYFVTDGQTVHSDGNNAEKQFNSSTWVVSTKERHNMQYQNRTTDEY